MPNDPQSNQAITPEERAALWKRIADVKYGMLTTLEDDGMLAARPMTTQRVDAGGVLWFFMSATGNLARALSRDPRVGLTFSDSGDNFYVSLSGNGECFRDPQMARELWNPLAGAWFPGGSDDPDLALLRIDVDQGDSWEAKSGKLVQFLTIAKAAITRKPPDNAGEHRHFVA